MNCGIIEGFDSTAWHTVKITAADIHISADIDGTEVTAFDDETAFAHSGRVSVGSGLYNNLFDNLKIAPVHGYKSIITRIDDHDPSITYDGSWYRTVPDSYLNFNRTISRAEITGGDTGEKSFEFGFTGNHFAIIGQTDRLKPISPGTSTSQTEGSSAGKVCGSLNFYMFEGGTNLGFMSGRNGCIFLHLC